MTQMGAKAGTVTDSSSASADPAVPWAVGVDLGGTKVLVASVSADGLVGSRIRCHTEVAAGVAAVEAEIVQAVDTLLGEASSPPVGIGAAVAGQIDAATGAVRFSPNLAWRDVPLQADLGRALRLPVVVQNDVRAAGWGEWLHGAGRGLILMAMAPDAPSMLQPALPARGASLPLTRDKAGLSWTCVRSRSSPEITSWEGCCW
jgi:ROK family